MEKGYFISVEGLDGSGKTTQIMRMENFFKERGEPVYITREPGGTPLAEKIRKIILDKDSGNVYPLTEFFLYLACRAQHTQEIIMPKLNEGVNVISDRYADSSVAYQGEGRELSRTLVMDFNKAATKGTVPDLTVFIDIEPETAISRIEKMDKFKDRLEDQSIEFYRKVRNGYTELLKIFPDRFKRVDGNRSVEMVWEDIRNELLNLFTRRSRSNEV
ncbi:dTMP kinase [bacterium]|nr:dTMP kinase [bacterium]